VLYAFDDQAIAILTVEEAERPQRFSLSAQTLR